MSEQPWHEVAGALGTPTGQRQGWALYPVPSSGGLNPVGVRVAGDGIDLAADPRAAVAKYGAAGAVSAEVDLGAALPAVHLLTRAAGLQPSAVPTATGLRISGQPSSSALSTSEPWGPSRMTAALRVRRSRRSFAPRQVQVAAVAAVVSAGVTLHDEVRAMLPQLPPAALRVASLTPEARASGRWLVPTDGGLHPLPGPGPWAADLVEAACGQRWLAGGSAVIVVTCAHPVDDPADDPAGGAAGGEQLSVGHAWAAGSMASALHLAATAAGLSSCVVGAVRPDVLRALLPAGHRPARTGALTLFVVMGAPDGLREPGGPGDASSPDGG